MCENSLGACPGRGGLSSPEPCASRLSYPTCQDLGIPYPDFPDDSPRHDVMAAKRKVNGMTYDDRDPNNPFSPYCRIPLPNPFGSYEYGFEPAFIRKRNERERERVRCVNEGYHRLRQHLPIESKDKRISKVETLRCAISYIEQLQGMLHNLDKTATGDKETSSEIGHKRKLGRDETDDTKNGKRSRFDTEG